MVDTEQTVLAWNPACEFLTGIKANSIIGSKNAWRAFYDTERPILSDFIINDDRASLEHWYPNHGSSQRNQGIQAEAWFSKLNGKKRYLTFDAAPILDDDGNTIAAVQSLEDITEIKQVEDRLMLSDKVFSSTNQAIMITDAKHRIVQSNQSFTRLTGYELEEVMGKSSSILRSDEHDDEFYQAMQESLDTKGHWEGEIWDKRKDNELFAKWLSVSSVFDDKTKKVSHYISLFSDITERKLLEDEVRHIAFHDSLTGLPNRILFYDRLESAIESAKRKSVYTALMFIDLDRFKNVNDTLGHHIGDILLQEVSARLKQTVRGADTVARLGGDEFVIILPDIERFDDVSLVADKLLTSLNQPFNIENNELFSPPSIGISLFPIDGLTPEVLMQSADTAMYHAKEQGRNHYQYFTQAMTDVAHERASLEHDLRLAIELEELELHYQPKVALHPTRVVGCEALLRWRRAGGDYIPPDKFIPIAEDAGLMNDIGEWVLLQAAKDVNAWRSQGLDELCIAINLSPIQFSDESLPDKIHSFLKSTDLSPALLELEITESILMDSIKMSSEAVKTIKETGVEIAIDDFGTGYSSLAYLKSFAINTLKIDRSFINDIHTSKDSSEIVSAVISLSHNLELNVVAEGVETKEQLAFLSHLDCDIYQGYYFSKPLPADVFYEFAQSKKKYSVM